MGLQGQHVIFPHIPVESWREQAACAGKAPMFDASLPEHESGRARDARFAAARNICNLTCPVRKECAAAYDWRYDEGVRGGHVTPPLVRTQTMSPRDREMHRLLRRGVPLDWAAEQVRRRTGKAS